MSFRLVDRVLKESGAANADRLVLLALASFANDDGTGARPGVERICEHAHLSLTAVRDALARLVESGRIIEQRGPGRTRTWLIVLGLEIDAEARAELVNKRRSKRESETRRGRREAKQSANRDPVANRDPDGHEGTAPANRDPAANRDPVAANRDPVAGQPGSGANSVLDSVHDSSVELAPDGAAGASQNGTDPTPSGQSRSQRAAAADVHTVFEAWIESTGRTSRTVLDAKRRRLIEQRLADFPVADLLDAVRGWRHSPHHRGENEQRTVYNDLGLLLRDAANVERFRDLERDSGVTNGTGTSHPIRERDLRRPGQATT